MRENPRDSSIARGEYALLARADCSKLRSESTAGLLKSASSDAVTIIEIARDIAERKEVEEELRWLEEKLRRIFDSVADAITVTDLNGIVTEANEKAAPMHGFSSKDEVLGKNAFDLIARQDRERAMANMLKTAEEGAVRNIEYTLIKADGSEFPAKLSASVLNDASGNPVGFITVTRDITKRKQLEEKQRELDQMKSEFISNVSHELRTPLHSIKGFIKLMLEGKVPDPDTQKEFLSIKVGESMGSDDYATKPAEPAEILTKVETMLASGSKVVHGAILEVACGAKCAKI